MLVLKVAQVGRLLTEKVRRCPSGSDAVGRNDQFEPATTLVVVGVPEITGGRLGGAVTVMLNAGSEAESDPSDTLMRILP